MLVKDEYKPKNLQIRRIAKDTWIVIHNESHTYTYVLKGKESALVINPCFDGYELRETIENIVDVPIIVVNTKYDESCLKANRYFTGCFVYISQNASDYLCINKKTIEIYENIEFKFIKANETKQLDLGNRKIYLREFDVQLDGGVILFDVNTKILFTGDAIESDQVVLLDHLSKSSVSIERYKELLSNLKTSDWDIQNICPSQNGSPIDNVVDDLLENCKRIIDGYLGSKDITTANFLNEDDSRDIGTITKLFENENLRKSCWKDSTIIYDVRHIFES